MSRPVIGVCAAYERARWSFWDQQAALVPASYLDAISKAGGVALAIPPSEDWADGLERLLSFLDGVMLIGGADVDPQFYGHEHLDVTEQVYPERDAFELALVSKALEMDVPFLGVCRGLQILNVALGGTLKQDIADDEGQNLHRRRLGGFEGTDHIVSIDPGSRLHGVIGDASTTVRCHHHQAIDELGHGLTVTARADADELVEAVELPSNRFALGVQWHPEADTRSRVIAGLIEACNAGDETVREIQLDRMV